MYLTDPKATAIPIPCNHMADLRTQIARHTLDKTA